MSRPDPFLVTETYSFALAPVIGPFLEALGHLAQSIGTATHALRTESAAITSTSTTLDD
jgi:hypothetical protein